MHFKQHGGGHELGPIDIVDAIASFWAEVAAKAKMVEATDVGNATSTTATIAMQEQDGDDGADDELELARALQMSMEDNETTA
eukprot:SAG31_NODE_4928_length_2857_cov_1.877810_2_plen_83_part_00